MKMKLKKETKHTIVYEASDDTAPVSSVYVSKMWLALQPGVQSGQYPQAIELKVEVAQ